MENSLYYNEIKSKEVRDFLNRIPKELKARCIFKKIEDRGIIVLKGNEIHNVYIACKGSMEVKNEFANGFTYSFASIDKIAYIGIMELMANQNSYSSTLKATSECILLEIPKEEFLVWFKGNRELILEVLAFVSRCMYEQSLKSGEGMAYPSICTLVDYLINVYKSENCETVFLKKSREEIGSILGFSVRTINRNLKELKEENLVTVTRKGIQISKENFKSLCEKQCVR